MVALPALLVRPLSQRQLPNYDEHGMVCRAAIHPHRVQCHQGDDSDGNEPAFCEACCNIAKCENIAALLQRWIKGQRGADVCDDQRKFQKGPDGKATIKAAFQDERRVAQGLRIELHERRDRSGKGDDEQQSGQPCQALHPVMEIVRRRAARCLPWP